MNVPAVIGLRTATLQEIEELKVRYPSGVHVTHSKNTGTKLPFNGVFITKPKD